MGISLAVLMIKHAKNPLSELKIVPFDKDPSNNDHQLKAFCEKHPNKEIEFKCLQDFAFLCSLCLLEHNDVHQKDKLNLTLDMNIIEEKLIQLKNKTDSYLEKAKTIKASNFAKSNELLEFFKISNILLKSPFCLQFNHDNKINDIFPLDFSPFKKYDFANISAIAMQFKGQ